MEKNQSQKQNNVSPYSLIILAVLLGLYLIIQIVLAFSSSIQTVAATHDTENDSISANGWLIRDEVAISGKTDASTVKHIVFSGEHVKQDAPLAMLFTGESALEINQEIDNLDSRIRLLDSALTSAGDVSDAAKIDQQITQTLQQLASLAKKGTGTALTSAASSIRSLSLKREAGVLDSNSITAERDTLKSQRDELSNRLSGQTTQINAPASGYFSEVVDGYETILTLDQLDEMTPDSYNNLIRQQPVSDTKIFLGKIIKGFTWYLAAEVSPEDAARLKPGKSVKISFTQASVETPATVYRIAQPEEKNGKALVLLAGTEFSSELVSMREQPVEIILNTYTGLKVPKEAVRVVENDDGTTTLGVFILSGSVTRFKTIQPIFEADTFYLVEQSATDADSIVDKDQIVIRGKDLQNNMVVS